MIFPTIEEISQKVAEQALDGFIYKDRTLREWADLILKFDPCPDVISREAVLNKINEICFSKEWTKFRVEYGSKGQIDNIINFVETLSPVTPQQKWIPVSKRLPEENKTVIASTEYGVFPESKYTKEYGWEWAYESGADYWRELKYVTAWMLLPEPYEPQESEDKE